MTNRRGGWAMRRVVVAVAWMGAVLPAHAGSVEWRDPVERAFSLDVPEDWTVEGGTSRPSALLVQARVDATSPDRQVYLYMGDTFPIYVEPNQVLAYAGIGEGGTYVDPTGARNPVRSYCAGARYIRDYLLPERVGRFEVISERETPDVVREINDLWARNGGMAQYHAGTIRFRFEGDGRRVEGAALCITELLTAPSGRMWHPWRVYYYECAPGRNDEAEAALVRMSTSYRIDPDWMRRQREITEEQIRVITETQDRISRRIEQTSAELFR